MAWAQNDTSREISDMSRPMLDLNHWRSPSTRLIATTGTSQIRAARRVMSSYSDSGRESGMP